MLAAYPFGLLAATFVTGCGGNEGTDNFDWMELGLESATGSQAVPSPPSVILTNSLDPEALVPTDIGVHALQGMSAETTASLRSPGGALLRQLLKYAVDCALDVGSHFDFFWVDSTGAQRSESYAGHWALGSGWLNHPLSLSDQQAVSACLAARTNWYGQEVTISMRGSSPKLEAAASEMVQFSRREGTFWGNLFSSDAHLHACYDAPNRLYARTKHRDCAAGHVESNSVLECGMIKIVGPCDQACFGPTLAGYYSSCSTQLGGGSAGAQTPQVITVFLQ